jgi:hypothetical protein
MSTLRCKPGDLAIHVNANLPENIGKLCIVLEPYDKVDENGPYWLCEATTAGNCVNTKTGAIIHTPAGQRYIMPDAWLRPIRPSEGEDESMSWSRPRVEEPA